MATTPGILVSEEPQSPIINFGYRGLNSQRSEFMQVLEDGISLKNEQFGFPETHYTPILDAVERIELIRAGAALQYGCQPGGALNFVMKMPRLDAPFHFTTRNVFGSYGYYRNYTEVDGTVGPFGYYLYYDHRQQDGFREANSDYDLNNGSSRFVWDVTRDSQFILTLDFYDENHGEPGGMRRREEVNPPNSVFLEDGFTQTSRFFDRFRLERYYAMLDTKSFSLKGRNSRLRHSAAICRAGASVSAAAGLARCPAETLRVQILFSCAKHGQRASMPAFVTTTICSTTFRPLPAVFISITRYRTGPMSAAKRRTQKAEYFAI